MGRQPSLTAAKPVVAMPTGANRQNRQTRRAALIRPNKASAWIYDALRQDILILALKPGDPISEKELAAEFGVSRTPIREAILKLSEEGLVDIFPQSGTFVSRIPIDEFNEAMTVRGALEKTTAALAAQNRGSQDLALLHSIIDRQILANKASDRDEFHSADEDFHRAIASAASFPNIWRLINTVKYQVDRYRRLTLPAPGRMTKVIAEHRAILDAIEAGDPAGATNAMDEHLSSVIDFANLDHVNPDYIIRTIEPQRS